MNFTASWYQKSIGYGQRPQTCFSSTVVLTDVAFIMFSVLRTYGDYQSHNKVKIDFPTFCSDTITARETILSVVSVS